MSHATEGQARRGAGAYRLGLALLVATFLAAPSAAAEEGQPSGGGEIQSDGKTQSEDSRSPAAPLEAPSTDATLRPIILWTTAPDDELSRQLSIELRSMGFHLLVQAPSTSQQTTIETERARALVEVRSGAEVVIYTPKGDALGLTSPEEYEARVFAKRIAEQVRASLLLSSLTAGKPKTPIIEATQPATVSAPREAFRASVGGSVEGGAGGLGVAGRISAGIAYFPFESFGLSGKALLPVHAQTASGAEGSAQIWTTTLLLGPSVRLLLTSDLECDLSVLIGGSIVSMVGEADAPRPSQTDTVTPFTLSTYLGANYFISKHVFARLAGGGLVYLPPITVNFADRVAASREFVAAGELALGARF